MITFHPVRKDSLVFQIFFNNAALEPVEDIFLTELRINFEEFNTSKGQYFISRFTTYCTFSFILKTCNRSSSTNMLKYCSFHLNLMIML